MPSGLTRRGLGGCEQSTAFPGPDSVAPIPKMLPVSLAFSRLSNSWSPLLLPNRYVPDSTRIHVNTCLFLHLYFVNRVDEALKWNNSSKGYNNRVSMKNTWSSQAKILQFIYIACPYSFSLGKISLRHCCLIRRDGNKVPRIMDTQLLITFHSELFKVKKHIRIGPWEASASILEASINQTSHTKMYSKHH